jgi:L-threonylcarbamoyladenylate synthase
MRRFWPGPLTLLLPRSGRIPDQVTAGRGLVGVRMPAHPVAARLIALAGVPVAAPSANRFGHVSPTTAAHVLEDLEGRIDAVIDAGPAVHGLESTVVDASRLPVTVYRPGALPLEAIRAAVGEAILYQPAPQNAAPAALPSPGVGIRHYAPRARLLLVEWPEGAGSEGEAGQIQRRQLQQRIEAEQKQPGKLGVLLAGTEAVDISPGVEVVRWGAPDGDEQARLDAMGSGLFAALRLLDSLGCDRILCPLPPDRGLGRAIRDRLLKAAREV